MCEHLPHTQGEEPVKRSGCASWQGGRDCSRKLTCSTIPNLVSTQVLPVYPPNCMRANTTLVAFAMKKLPKQITNFRLVGVVFFYFHISLDHGWNLSEDKVADFLQTKKPQIFWPPLSRVFCHFSNRFCTSTSTLTSFFKLHPNEPNTTKGATSLALFQRSLYVNSTWEYLRWKSSHLCLAGLLGYLFF